MAWLQKAGLRVSPRGQAASGFSDSRSWGAEGDIVQLVYLKGLAFLFPAGP